MKKAILIWLLLIMSIGIFKEACAANYKDVLGSFKGVSAVSNGVYTGTSVGDYQCVELVKRFYRDAMGINLYKSIGVARNYYLKYNQAGFEFLKKSGLIRFTNGSSSSLPAPGDILVFDNSNGIGHVAIVKYVVGSKIEFIEQNWNKDSAIRQIDFTYNGTNYYLATVSGYSVLGWLHLPQGEFTNGWHFDSDTTQNTYSYNTNSRPFTTSYENNGSNDVLGQPINDVHLFSAGNKSLVWPYSAMKEAWIQDFSKNNNSYTLVVNEYVTNIQTCYLGVAYPIGGQIRTYWLNHYWDLGFPRTNEYYYAGGYISTPSRYVVQWFERLKNDYAVVIFDTWTGNIWHESNLVTGVPQENFAQHQEKNSTYNEGIGGGTGVDYTLYRTATAKGVDTNYNPVGETSEFLRSDGSVYTWVQLDNVYGLHDISWKLYSPDNTEIGNSSYSISTDPAGQTYKSWSWFDISSISTYGQFHIDTHIDGIKIDTRYFNLNVVLDQPTGLTASNTAADTTTLNWTATPLATSYRIYRNGQLLTEITQLTYTDTGLLQNSAYTYYVQALNSTYASAASSSITITTPYITIGPPTTLLASNLATTSVKLSWTAGLNATSYKIYCNSALIGESNTALFTDTGLTANTNYSYFVTSVNGVVTSVPSNVISVTTPFPGPSAPMNLTATKK